MKLIKLTMPKLFWLFLSMLILCLYSCDGAVEREEKYLQKANTYFSDENYQKAKVEIKNVLQINPKNSKARVLLGKINQREGEYRQALANFSAAAEEDAKQVDARIELAKIFLSASRDVDAEKYIKEALAIEPTNNEGKAISAGIHMRAGDSESAIRIANEVLTANPGNPQAIAVLTAIYISDKPELALEKINSGLALDKTNIPLKMLKIEVLKRSKNVEEVEKLYLELIKENPTNLRFYDKLAGDYTAQGKLDSAENIVRQAIVNNPESVDPILALVDFVKKMKGTEESEKVLKEFISKKPDLYILKRSLANLYLQIDKKSEAKDIFSSVISKNSTSSDALSARVDLAKIYLVERDTAKASSLLDEIYTVEPSNADARILSARIKMSENKIKDAIADLRTALKSDARSLEAFKLLAFAQEKDGTPDLALDSYFRALDIGSDDLTSLFGAARLSIKNQQKDTGKKLLDRILVLDPSNPEATLMLTNLMIANKDWTGAEKLCQSLIDTDSVAKKATGFNALGGVYSAQSQWKFAKQNYEQSLLLSPKSYDPLAGIVNAMLAENKTTDAIHFIETHLKTYPDLNRVKRLLANLYVKENKTQAAIDIYESLILATPEDESLYESLAAIYFEKKDRGQSEAVYMRGLARNPDSVSIRAYLGNLYTFEKKYEAAKEQYEIAHSKMPNSDMIKNNLAILLINNLPSEGNTRKALELVSGFSSSKEPNYLDTLGWVQLHAGNTPQAISFLQQAVGMKQSPEFRYHLGVAYKKNGQLAEAKKELTLATKEVSEASKESEWIITAQKELATL
jgi:tetratricopeptide (TPR) repeat protein